MEKKYEMLKDDCVSFGYREEWHKLYRIKALRDFCDVSKGDIGGYIESEDNLSHSGACWVYGDARVFDEARVTDNSSVCEEVRVTGNATIRDDSFVGGSAVVKGNAIVCDFACVGDKATIAGYAIIRDHARVYGNATIRGHAIIGGAAYISDGAEVMGEAQVKGVALVCGDAQIRGNAIIDDNLDYIVFKNWWSSGRFFTWTRQNNMWAVGCFFGTGEELIKKAYQDSDISGREYERVVRYTEGIMKDYDKAK